MRKIVLLFLGYLLLAQGGVAFAEENISTKDVTAGANRKTYADDAWNWFKSDLFGGDLYGEKGAQHLVFRIAYDLKNVLIVLTIVYMFVLVLRLLFGQGSEDDLKKWRIGILWSTIGIVLMQLAYPAAMAIFDKQIGSYSAYVVGITVIEPIIRLLTLVTSFIFIATAIIAFFRMVTGASEEAYKKGINTIINCVIGFILVKISSALVFNIYGKVECSPTIGTQICSQPFENPNLSNAAKIFASIIQYATGFVGLITVLLIIYAGLLLITSSGDEGRSKKAKGILKYIFFGMILIASSVVLYRFIIGAEITGIIGRYKN